MTQILEYVFVIVILLSAVGVCQCALLFGLEYKGFDENVTNSRAIVCTTHINLMIMKSSTFTVHHDVIAIAISFLGNAFYFRVCFHFNVCV